MKFKVKKKEVKRKATYPREEFEIAKKFAERVYKEFGPFIKAVVLFGSTMKKEKPKKADIDILVVLDDVKIKFTEDIVQTYRIITEKIIADTAPQRLHVQSMKLTSFWEYIRAGDPVAINILRYGIALIDTGFFDPLQALLDQGRIRPSKEAVYAYFTMAPSSLHKATQHLLTATIDLYWAAIDSAHAALMSLGEIPPSPNHVSDMLKKKLVKEGYISEKYANTMELLYNLFKKITHREIKEITGKEYDKYRKLAQDFVNKMQKFIEKREKHLI